MILIITREKMVLILLQIQAVLIPLFSSQVIILKLPGKPPTVMGIIWFMFLKMVKVALQLSITSPIRIKALNYFIMRVPMGGAYSVKVRNSNSAVGDGSYDEALLGQRR